MLPEVIEYANDCHLYIIAHRPMTVVDPESLRIDGNLMTARFINRVDSEESVVECTWTQPHVKGGVKIETTWPHNVLRIFDASGKRIARGNASLFLSYAMANAESDSERLHVDTEFLDLAVDYVGKAYGADGKRGAFTRLQSHSTLQRILVELSRDMEAWLIMLDSTKYTVYSTIVPSGSPRDEQDLEDDEHIERTLGSELDYGVVVDLVEGCLVKYFQPPYNVQLKESFPKSTAKPLAELYARDLNSIGFELDIRHLGVRLRSADEEGVICVGPSFEHGAVYRLHDLESRKDMFDFVDDIDALAARRESRYGNFGRTADPEAQRY